MIAERNTTKEESKFRKRRELRRDPRRETFNANTLRMLVKKRSKAAAVGVKERIDRYDE